MSDLISRSELIRRIESEYREYGEDYDAEQILGDIEDMQTAYDIDKVVEELKQKKEEVQRMRNTCVSLSDLEVCDIENVTYERAIEIVKQGGVSYDVCEWKDKDKVIYASCNNKQRASEFCWFNECGDYKYCPYCGKKIKVVE